LSLVELLIYLAVLSILLAGSHSWFTHYSIRAKIAEAVKIADSGKKDILLTCAENPNIPSLSSAPIGHQFAASEYIESISLSGSCQAPVITVATRNTGLMIAPTLTITGGRSGPGGRMEWVCTSDGPDAYVPGNCRD
jgi:hypothetical protein